MERCTGSVTDIAKRGDLRRYSSYKELKLSEKTKLFQTRGEDMIKRNSQPDKEKREKESSSRKSTSMTLS